MAKKRLLNCEFVNASSFKVNISNKAKLLYLMMFTNADDKGFVDTTNEIINSLTTNDSEFRNEINLELLNNDFKSALNELVEKGLIYDFTDNHKNHIYLIRHWFFHNKLIKGLWSNYGSLVKQVDIVDNEYVLKKSNIKENNNINKLNHNKLNQDKVSYGNKEITEPTETEPKQEKVIINENELNEDDYPFDM